MTLFDPYTYTDLHHMHAEAGKKKMQTAATHPAESLALAKFEKALEAEMRRRFGTLYLKFKKEAGE